MGLDTTHNCWHGAYSRFNRFRYLLAEKIGIDLNEYIGYDSHGTKKLESIEHDLMPLFNHSDCDGELTVEESKRIVFGLNSVLTTLTEDDELLDMKDRIIQFRDGCLDAISKNETIIFA